MPDVDQWRAVDCMFALRVLLPARLVHLKMQRCDFGEQAKHAIGRTQVAAPHARAAAIHQADRDRRQR